MSSDPVGGYILSTLTRAALIAVTLKAMEMAPNEFEVWLPEDGFPLLPKEGFPFRKESPPEKALALLAQEASGVIEGQDSKSGETFWFEPVVVSYNPINVWVNDRVLDYERWPEQTDFFVKRWLQLCEQGQAVFGYFSPFFFMSERDYIEEKVLPAFQHGTVRDFLERIDSSWLIYLGSELAARWRQEQMPSYTPLLLSQDLPSGAHFFRISLDISYSSSSTLNP